MATAVNVLPSVSQTTAGDLVVLDCYLCPDKIPTVAWSATPLPPGAHDHVLLLLAELPVCCDALGWALLPDLP